jgi:hypothetical protein
LLLKALLQTETAPDSREETCFYNKSGEKAISKPAKGLFGKESRRFYLRIGRSAKERE